MTSIDPCAPIHPAPSSTQTESLSSSGVSEGAHCQVVFEKRWNGQGKGHHLRAPTFCQLLSSEMLGELVKYADAVVQRFLTSTTHANPGKEVMEESEKKQQKGRG
ncbi:hypothetical protein NQZ68_028950, partial [Dissostichus eleginoides]